MLSVRPSVVGRFERVGRSHEADAHPFDIKRSRRDSNS